MADEAKKESAQNEIPKEDDEISKEDDEIPKEDDEISKEDGEIPKDDDEISKNENKLLKDEDERLKDGDALPKHEDKLPKDEGELLDKNKTSEISPKKSKSDENCRLRNIFTRPRNAEPKHPIFSSPYARHISARAFGPKKPKWYTPLTSAQLYLFKDIMNYVEIGRESHFRFDDFTEALQDFDPGITGEEVLSILDSMEKSEFEELDFGKFLFLLAYRDNSQDGGNLDDIDKMLSSPTVTPRQCLILSAISYYILIASPEEVERYYISNTRRKATVLHYHMESSRLLGLTEKQMEEKQKKAMQHLGPLFAVTGSPYACPVPFVPSAQKSKLLNPKSAKGKKPISRPIKPIKQKREFKEKVVYKTIDDKTFYDMHYGRLPMPSLKIPEEMRKEMRKKCTVVHKDYITRKSYEAKEEYKARLKKATVLYNKRSLDFILEKGFPSDMEKNAFIEVYERYMPLKLEDVKNFSLWVKPAGYELNHDGKQLYPDKIAFGSIIP